MSHIFRCEKWFHRLKVKFERFNVGMYRDEAGDTVRLPPVVLGDLGKDPRKKTLCIYTHLGEIRKFIYTTYAYCVKKTLWL